MVAAFRGPRVLGRARRAHAVARRATLAVGVVCSLVGWFVSGLDGLASGIVATLVVVVFFWSGMIPLFVVQRTASPTERPNVAAGLGVLLLTYTLRLALVLAALGLSERLGVVDAVWLGATVIACTLAWVVAHVSRAVSRPRQLVVSDHRPPEAAP